MLPHVKHVEAKRSIIYKLLGIPAGLVEYICMYTAGPGGFKPPETEAFCEGFFLLQLLFLGPAVGRETAVYQRTAESLHKMKDSVFKERKSQPSSQQK